MPLWVFFLVTENLGNLWDPILRGYRTFAMIRLIITHCCLFRSDAYFRWILTNRKHCKGSKTSCTRKSNQSLKWMTNIISSGIMKQMKINRNEFVKYFNKLASSYQTTQLFLASAGLLIRSKVDEWGLWDYAKLCRISPPLPMTNS